MPTANGATESRGMKLYVTSVLVSAGEQSDEVGTSMGATIWLFGQGVIRKGSRRNGLDCLLSLLERLSVGVV